MNQLSILCQKMHTERLKTLKENEEFVQKGGFSSNSSSSWDDDEEDVGNEGQNSPPKIDGADNSDDSEEQ